MTDELTPLNTGHLGLKSFHWKIGILIKSWLPTLLIRQQGSGAESWMAEEPHRTLWFQKVNFPSACWCEGLPLGH